MTPADELRARTDGQLRMLIGDLVLTVARQAARIEQLEATAAPAAPITKGNGQAPDAPTATGARDTNLNG
jgi:hypothetical protein